MANEVDEYIKRLVNHKGVVGVLVINAEGIPIKSTIENSVSIQYAGEMQLIIDKARSLIKEMDSTNDLSFIRLRTRKHEVLVAPGKLYRTRNARQLLIEIMSLDKEYAMIVIQNQPESS